MTKDLKYNKLINEVFSSLNIFHWFRVGYNKVTGKFTPRFKYRKNINYKISICVLKPDKNINETFESNSLCFKYTIR